VVLRWAVTTLADWVAANWHTPDASLWEFRDDDDIYTHSQLMCWVALKVAQTLATEVMQDQDSAQRWGSAADLVAQGIWEDQKNSGLPYFTQGHHHRHVDAALLTMALYGFVAVDDPVFVQTVQHIEEVLLHNDFVYRYREDNMGPVLYPFTLAGFWLARVYMRMGKVERADALIEAEMRCVTDLGLFAEHVDPKTFEPHGNFPQLFPHAALITTLTERNQMAEGFPSLYSESATS
jgi:GH15 family glucan-1,4-alpha-glucosidase